MAVVDVVPVDAIRERAEAIDPARVALALLAIPFLVIGWLARMVVRAVWLVLSWAFAAVQVGWAQAAPSREPEDGS